MDDRKVDSWLVDHFLKALRGDLAGRDHSLDSQESCQVGSERVDRQDNKQPVSYGHQLTRKRVGQLPPACSNQNMVRKEGESWDIVIGKNLGI